MSENHEPLTFPGDGREEWPAFELDYAVDRPHAPERLTIHVDADSDGLATRWLAVDFSAAVPVEEVR